MLNFNSYIPLLLVLLIPLWLILKKMGILKSFSFPLLFTEDNKKYFDSNTKHFTFFSVVSTVLFCLAFVFIVIALANPKISHQEKRYVSRGTEIIFVVDSSPSMSALDIGDRTRLQAAKDSILYVTQGMPETSFGLVALANEAVCLVPPSMDNEIFKKQLEDIKIGALGDGTALGVGISNAVYHLSSSAAPQKAIVLITDGENNAGTVHPFTAAKLSAELKIPIYVLGLGTTGTVPVEYTDPKTGKTYSGYLESGFNSESLEQIAKITKADYFDVQNLPDLREVISSIVRNESVVPHFYTVSVDEEYYSIFLILAICCILLGYLVKRFYLRNFL